jgi:hypothetical protein
VIDPIGILIWLLVFCLFIWVVFLLLGEMPMRPQVRQIVTAIVAVIFLIVLLQHIGFFARPVVMPR